MVSFVFLRYPVQNSGITFIVFSVYSILTESTTGSCSIMMKKRMNMPRSINSSVIEKTYSRWLSHSNSTNALKST